jgi:hypothetical protein
MPWRTDRSLHLLEKVLETGERDPAAVRDRALGPIISEWRDQDIVILSQHFKNETLVPVLRSVLEHPEPVQASQQAVGPVAGVLKITSEENLTSLARLWNERSPQCVVGRE